MVPVQEVLGIQWGCRGFRRLGFGGFRVEGVWLGYTEFRGLSSEFRTVGLGLRI